jgi:hypothetical protein
MGRAHAALGLSLLIVAPLVAIAARSRSSPRRPGPFVVIARAQEQRAGPVDPNAMALLLRAIDPALRERLSAALEALDAKTNPLAIALEEESPEDPLRELEPLLLPASTAAEALVRTEYEVGGRRGRLSTTCPAGATCIPIARTRLSVWAWRFARRVPPDRAKELRAQAAEPASTVALVVDRATLAEEPAEITALRARARAIARRLSKRGVEDPVLSAIAQAPTTVRLPLPLPEGHALVVPRLGALARMAGFERELAR